MTASVLAADVGQTGSRLALRGAGADWRHMTGDPLVAGADPLDSIYGIIVRALAALADRPDRIDTVCVGFSGLNGREAEADQLLARLHEALGTTRAVVADDAVTSYLGAIGTSPGVVVAAGTGAVALATDGAGAVAHVDGAGYLLGDAGSGYWIGRAGLDGAWRAHDGRGGSAALLASAVQHFGELERLPARLMARSDRVSAIASFAEPVAAVARAGDDCARAIWLAAAEELAQSAHAALVRCGIASRSVEVSVAGALARAEDLLIEPFSVALARRCPAARFVRARGTSLDGAMLLAAAPIVQFGGLAASAVVGDLPRAGGA
jgi:N-acetylglucosamine kinase-like BadF-type ATPase